MPKEVWYERNPIREVRVVRIRGREFDACEELNDALDFLKMSYSKLEILRLYYEQKGEKTLMHDVKGQMDSLFKIIKELEKHKCEEFLHR